MTSTYGLSSLGAGILATVVGRLLPRHGPRRLYLLGAVLVAITYPLALVVTTFAGGFAGSLLILYLRSTATSSRSMAPLTGS